MYINDTQSDFVNKVNLMNAAKYGDLEGAKAALDAGADPNVGEMLGNTALMYACDYYGNVDIVKLLLDHGADPNIGNNYGTTPLMIASKYSIDAVKLLLDAGADPNAVNDRGETALTYAVQSGHEDIANLLKSFIANKNLTNTTPTQPSNNLGNELIDAVMAGDLRRFKSLLAEGADVNARDEYGRTALMEAAAFNEVDMVKMLIESGADVNAVDKYGYTALMLAAFYGFKEIVELLLEHGADVSKENNNGYTALRLAEDNNEVANLLKAHGGKIWSIIY